MVPVVKSYDERVRDEEDASFTPSKFFLLSLLSATLNTSLSSAHLLIPCSPLNREIFAQTVQNSYTYTTSSTCSPHNNKASPLNQPRPVHPPAQPNSTSIRPALPKPLSKHNMSPRTPKLNWVDMDSPNTPTGALPKPPVPFRQPSYAVAQQHFSTSAHSGGHSHHNGGSNTPADEEDDGGWTVDMTAHDYTERQRCKRERNRNPAQVSFFQGPDSVWSS